MKKHFKKGFAACMMAAIMVFSAFDTGILSGINGTMTVYAEEIEKNIIDDFETEGTEAVWAQETGWQYDNTIGIGREFVNGSNQLKLDMDYTGCEEVTWSEAKIKRVCEGIDVSVYNLLTYELTYPETLEGHLKTKVFATSGTDEIINKEGTAEVTDLGNGLKKALVSVRFRETSKKITDITIGTVGVNTGFKGSIYMDNITLTQYDADTDFVTVTSATGDATIADLSKMKTSVSLADTNAKDFTKALYAYLEGLDAANQVLFGHQNDTHKHTGTNDGVYSDTKDVTGSISAVVGIDSLALTGVELDLTNVDEALAKSVQISKEAAAEGAIITLSTHMPNMSDSKIIATPNNSRKYDFSACNFGESKNLSNNCSQEVLPNGKYNEQFTTYLDIIADYALALQEENIPLLFRPFHENTGGWFWWGSATTDIETYNALYRYTVDYLSDIRGVHNILYVYSPNGPIASEEEYAKRYPGDDYVDIVAFDYYNDYNTYPAEYSEDFMTSLDTTCQVVKGFAEKHGKVAAIAETGVRVMKQDGSDNEGLLVKNNPIKNQNWYQRVSNIAKANDMSYFLLWANFSDTNFYVPYKNGDKGQELINEFIDYYNDNSSVFANGTNFYGKASETAVTNTKIHTAGGYFTNVFSKGIIKDGTLLSASVKNAENVQFILKNNEISHALVPQSNGNTYQATVTAEDIAAVGQTDVGTIELVADGKTLITLTFMSFGKEKETLSTNIIENFELYYGDNDYLNGTYTENSAANCFSAFVLDTVNKSSGSYGGSFNYKLKTNGSEVWTGRMKGLDSQDYSAYNAITMWMKPDGKGQKLVMQLVSGGEDFEVFLTDFVATTEAKYITIPFSQLKGKNGGTFHPADVTKFAVWCNSIPANGATDIESSIVFDDIQFVNIDTSALNIQNGYAITNESVVQEQKNEEKEAITKEEVKEETTSIQLNKTAKRVKKGKMFQLKATITPSDMPVKWNTFNEKVATVSNTGKVKGIKQGTATIMATATDKNGVEVTATCKITVPYNITYKLNKGTNHEKNPSTYYKENITLKNPNRKGYAFKGWYADKNFKKKVTKITKSSKKNITLYAKWSKITVKQASIKSVKDSSEKTMKVTVNQVSGAKGYKIVYSQNKKFKNKKTVTITGTSTKIKKLTKGKTYYVKVRAYKKDSAGKKVYGKYSSVKKIKISK